MNKLEKNGLVAIIYSPGYSAGWSTWNDPKYSEFLTMDGYLAQLVIDEKFDEIEPYLNEKFGENTIYTGAYNSLSIKWIPKGAMFQITVYDGDESVYVIGKDKYMIA